MMVTDRVPNLFAIKPLYHGLASDDGTQVEAFTFGAEFITACTCLEAVEALWFKTLHV